MHQIIQSKTEILIYDCKNDNKLETGQLDQ